MIRRSALLACAIAAGIGAIAAPRASADEFEVPFEGTIGNLCEFNLDSAGVVSRSQGSSYALEGDSAEVSVNCSGPASVSVTGVEQAGGTTQFGNMVADLVPTGGGPGGPVIPVQPGGESFGVNMFADSGNVPIENGDYIFNVLLTAAPN